MKACATLRRSMLRFSQSTWRGCVTVNSSEMYTPRAFEGGTKARDTLTYSMSDLAEADRATVVARIAAGESAADAEAEFMTDEYFEAWYQSLCDALRQYEG